MLSDQHIPMVFRLAIGTFFNDGFGLIHAMTAVSGDLRSAHLGRLQNIAEKRQE